MKRSAIKRKTPLRAKTPLRRSAIKKTQKSPRKKVSSPKSLKKRVWRAFSRYVRWQSADEKGFVECVSCCRIFPWDGVDAGHYYTNSERNAKFGGNELWYDIRNVHPQCRSCNSMHIHKEQAKCNYALWLEEEYGPGILQLLYKKKYTPRKFTRLELENLEKYFTAHGPGDNTTKDRPSTLY